MFESITIPFEPSFLGVRLNVHLILEFAAFLIAYRYYLHLRKRSVDPISGPNRLSIILGAAIGAFLGSRMMGFLENPTTNISLLELYNVKTIMGGLFGGLLGVETAKQLIGEKQSSGDLFTLPLIAGIFIGRIGCFLAGTNEFTYGVETTFVAGMDLGDGISRHPLALYELLFLGGLFAVLKNMYDKAGHEPGLIFRYFMVAYFGFRFLIEFLKPNLFYAFGLSSIQWLCVGCFVYYRKTLARVVRVAWTPERTIN